MLPVKPYLAALLLLSITTSLCAHPNASARIDYLDHQIEASPQNQSYYLKRAWLRLMNDQYERARADIAVADKLGPSSNSAYLKGLLYSKLDQTDQAIVFFNEARALHPNSIEILEARALAYRANSQTSLALNDYRQILKQSPAPSPSDYINTATLANNLRGYQAALSIIDEGLERLGLNPQLQQYAIQLGQANKQLSDAIARHQSLRKMMVNNPSWYLQHANLLIVNEQYGAAAEQLQAAGKLLKQIPSNPWTHRQKQVLAQYQLQLAKVNKLSHEPPRSHALTWERE